MNRILQLPIISMIIVMLVSKTESSLNSKFANFGEFGCEGPYNTRGS